jgi:hypothetical protein
LPNAQKSCRLKRFIIGKIIPMILVLDSRFSCGILCSLWQENYNFLNQMVSMKSTPINYLNDWTLVFVLIRLNSMSETALLQYRTLAAMIL